MKIGDLVRWKSSNMGTSIDEEHRGIIVDGPRAGSNGATTVAASWKVAWFHQDPYWHNDYCLEILNENW